MGDNHYRSADNSGNNRDHKLTRRTIRKELERIEESLRETKDKVPNKKLQNIRRHIKFVKDRIGNDDE